METHFGYGLIVVVVVSTSADGLVVTSIVDDSTGLSLIMALATAVVMIVVSAVVVAVATTIVDTGTAAPSAGAPADL